MCIRGSSTASISLTGRGFDLPFVDNGTDAEGVAGPTFSSTMVFQAPQAGHLPTHLGESAPHEVQNHMVFIDFFAIFRIFLEVSSSS
jgi:hypothetical protein